MARRSRSTRTSGRWALPRGAYLLDELLVARRSTARFERDDPQGPVTSTSSGDEGSVSEWTSIAPTIRAAPARDPLRRGGIAPGRLAKPCATTSASASPRSDPRADRERLGAARQDKHRPSRSRSAAEMFPPGSRHHITAGAVHRLEARRASRTSRRRFSIKRSAALPGPDPSENRSDGLLV